LFCLEHCYRLRAYRHAAELSAALQFGQVFVIFPAEGFANSRCAGVEGVGFDFIRQGSRLKLCQETLKTCCLRIQVLREEACESKEKCRD
jgi:hypothetical protein